MNPQCMKNDDKGGPALPPLRTVVIETDDEAQRTADLIALIRRAVPFAPDTAAAPDAAFSVSILSGGITNQLYKVTFPVAAASSRPDDVEARNNVDPATVANEEEDAATASIVVRVYGKETDRVISRAAEEFWQTQCLKTFGRAKNALVYEFLEGYRALEPEECVTHMHLVSKTIARLQHRAAGASMMTLPYATEKLFVFVALENWLSEAIAAKSAMKSDGDRALWEKYELVETVTAQCRWLIECLRILEPFMAIAPCHNDLLSGNVMVRGSPPGLRMDSPPPVPQLDEASSTAAAASAPVPSSSSSYDVKLIDFEYMRRNYALYDIANHFNEMAGFECKWDAQYPSGEERFHFLFTYLSEMKKLQAACTDCHLDVEEVSKSEVDNAVQVVEFLTLVSHIAWAVWAVVQGAHSVIEFDYLPYGLRRLERLRTTAAEIAEETSRRLGVELPPFPTNQ